MTTVKEQFMQILPQIQRDVSSMPDSEVQQIINIYMNWKPKQEQQTKKKHKAMGSLHHLADPSKIPGEEGAWARAAVEKYRRRMEKANETA